MKSVKELLEDLKDMLLNVGKKEEQYETIPVRVDDK